MSDVLTVCAPRGHYTGVVSVLNGGGFRRHWDVCHSRGG